MINISFAAGECLFTALWLLVRIIVWIRNGGIDLRREALLMLMYVNLAVIIRFSFFPFATEGGRVQPLVFDCGNVFPFRINIVPFMHLRDYVNEREGIINFIGNIAMYVPGGIILPVVYTKLDTFPKAVAAGALISLAVEILQLPFFVRVTDIDDLIMNTAGVITGYGIYALAAAAVRSFRKKHSGGI